MEKANHLMNEIGKLLYIENTDLGVAGATLGKLLAGWLWMHAPDRRDDMMKAFLTMTGGLLSVLESKEIEKEARERMH